jgi:hypothetical protein
MLYAKPWEHPSAVATLSSVIFLSAPINSSVHCAVASVAILTGWPGRASSANFERPWETFWTQLWTALRDTHFSPWTRNVYLWISFALSHFAHRTHNRTLLFSITLLKHGRLFDYWNPLLNMDNMYYLNCHEAGLCCYLVIHIENLSHPLQLFYFHLRHIY